MQEKIKWVKPNRRKEKIKGEREVEYVPIFGKYRGECAGENEYCFVVSAFFRHSTSSVG